MAADAAARRGHHPRKAVPHFKHWPGVSRVEWVTKFADPLSESPLETLGRFSAIAGGLPLPVSNAWVGPGFPMYRVDGLWPYHWAAFEADGALKYNNRSDASKIVQKQSEREWELRKKVSIDVLRFGFSEAVETKALSLRMTRFLDHNPRRKSPMRWWKDLPGFGPVDPDESDWPDPDGRDYCLPS
ncbi:hypothetical protein [Hoyosella altamirensis]|uniref:Uncharacterized protein n=1 Tax=Hoyosella altamirensis TaxID=616997 RepID=A0A839RU97_9ACTN|nr:hypothetical protein [Hoyosella altamirensis]MBB3039788.1 hypothetical protein [Hoyosella altamirensis]